MRQRLRKFLPIVLIALAVQILAPIAACWAAAIAASDPLHAIEICHSDPSAQPGSSDQGTDPHARDGGCPVCCLAQANASLDTPESIALAVPYLHAAAVVWRDAAPNLVWSSAHFYGQPRAPPQST
jgi:Protein of unknown function (DUF2946)